MNQEKTKQSIRQILNRMKTEADPHLLNEYRSLFKQEVSLFRRSWTAAYLLMLYEQGELGSAGRFDKKRSGRTPDKPGRSSARKPRTRSDEGGQAGKAPYPLAEEDSRRLFISIGRNRRVFPREILGFINAKTAIPREDIGAIRILDNFSFVQVRDTVADTIIEALNGQSFRGRVLTVSYARARKENGEDAGGDAEIQNGPEEDGGREWIPADADEDGDAAGGSGEDWDESGMAGDEEGSYSGEDSGMAEDEEGSYSGKNGGMAGDEEDSYSGDDREDPGEKTENPDE
jgi:hypothetical protein